MADYVPFLNSDDSVDVAKSIFSDFAAVRIPLDRAQRIIQRLPLGSKVWIDSCVDGVDDFQNNLPAWQTWMKVFDTAGTFETPSSWSKPNADDIQRFVDSILNACAVFNPAAISVPQIPMVNDTSRNRINRVLAQATGRWKLQSKFAGRLILPVIATHKEQLCSKTARKPRVTQAVHCFNESGASGTWVVDQAVMDEAGSVSVRRPRILALIGFHEDLCRNVAPQIAVGGPYWGTNILLWARGLVNAPAIGLGTGYQYFLPGRQGSTPKTRIVLPSLRRRVLHSEDLRDWLQRAITKLDSSHPAHKEFGYLLHHFSDLSQPQRAREQITTFYRSWLDWIATVPREGRTMAMFQDLAAAYALGKSLPELPSDEGPTRRPESIVEALMMCCLSDGS